MSEKPISPLRRRMIEDMTVRKFGEKTQSDYIRSVKYLTIFLGRSPDTATPEDLRRFQIELAENGFGASATNQTITALRFFFGVRATGAALTNLSGAVRLLAPGLAATVHAVWQP